MAEDDSWFWGAWAAYLEHVAPSEGPMCAECVAAETVTTGCAEGRRLYGLYRLARIGAPKPAQQ
ncbi:hypothetical protein CPT_Shaeky_067 [Streptomyces phage Shaeky]|uniref:Uncharacterized protein n=1 Tax=Streptomyces phage Shaeky TaxID=2767586 RepID=A0A873WVQ9_9CAUD|nr:hypothetical protein CPT_Shaeky_067 [Streptomyces phage Shaeky]